MKISVLICTMCLSLVNTAPLEKTDEQKIAELMKLYDIDIETKGDTVEGIRLRRSGDAALDDPIPEIDIKKINDEIYQVNGVRVKRGEVSKLSDVDLEKEIEAEEKELTADPRTRRSGSGGILEILGSKITQKLSLIAGASSGHNSEPDHSYGPPPTQSYDHKTFDVWQFKKAILNHLFQAVKAIKGGIIALSGKLIKVKGNLISKAGNVISYKGEAISGFGRGIAASALSPPATVHATSFATAAADDYPYPPASYGPPAHIPPTSYGVPQAYKKRGTVNDNFGGSQDLPHGVQAGLLVLKPAEQPINPFINPRNKGFGDALPSASEFIPNVAQSRSYYYQY